MRSMSMMVWCGKAGIFAWAPPRLRSAGPPQARSHPLGGWSRYSATGCRHLALARGGVRPMRHHHLVQRLRGRRQRAIVAAHEEDLALELRHMQRARGEIRMVEVEQW